MNAEPNKREMDNLTFSMPGISLGPSRAAESLGLSATLLPISAQLSTGLIIFHGYLSLSLSYFLSGAGVYLKQLSQHKSRLTPPTNQ